MMVFDASFQDELETLICRFKSRGLSEQVKTGAARCQLLPVGNLKSPTERTPNKPNAMLVTGRSFMIVSQQRMG